ncbi:MAG: azurin [Verrucomicrobiales bacterium]
MNVEGSDFVLPSLSFNVIELGFQPKKLCVFASLREAFSIFRALISAMLIKKFFTAFLLAAAVPAGAQQNIATPEKHPYVDPAAGRETHQPIASHKVNEARVYDFYQRQADYYMAMSPGEVPEILPAFPGLDAGKHGHWGKHNQNNHNDGRWNDMNHGPLVTQVFRNEDITVLKGMSIDLGNGVSAVFDPQALCYRSVWEGGFVKFQPFRWGSSRNAAPDGKVWFSDKAKKGWQGDEEGVYHGHYRDGETVILSYQIGKTAILDAPRGFSFDDDECQLIRQLTFPNGTSGLKLRLGTAPTGEGAWWRYEVVPEAVKITEDQDGGTWLETGVIPKGGGIEVALRFVENKERVVVLPSKGGRHDLRKQIHGGKSNFPDELKVSGTLGEPISADSSYIVDTLSVPFDNPYKTVMQLTSIAFNPDGTALVATLAGDVWKVFGIDESLQNVTWKRYATGFNQPIGIHIDDDGIFVLDRGQITRLHDYNNDDEVDFYENYANDFGGYDRSHTHTFGLHRMADGSFTFVQREDILRTGADRKTRQFAWGVRNCMGIGGSDSFAWVAPQEGTWTPASMIIEVNEGEFYGLPKKGDKNPTIAMPLCYIPRGVDNSTGGMIQVKSDRWGALDGHHLGVSYGSGSHYLILRDDSGPRPQGATVPLEGDFLAGTMRGAFNPKDGQLYLVGMDGWGDYSTQDGCFHRVRHTGNPFRDPVGFRVHSNGIRIDFAEPVSVEGAKVFAHQWNYEYANRYGSPEFSINHPKSLGHDVVAVEKVVSLNGGKAIFVEMPTIGTAMQMHLRMHLKSADGKTFKTNLFPSVLHLGEYFQHHGLAAPVAGKPTTISLRIAGRNKNDGKPTESGAKVVGAREVTVNAIGGLQFEQKEIKARAGEDLAIVLVNKDVMPHNLVIVKPRAVEQVGMASFAMLNDPDAGKKHYIPETESVIAHTFVVPAGSQHTLHLKAPSEPGDYPYICTFPGHWQAMRGVLKVQ